MEIEKAISEYFYSLAGVTIAFVGFAGLYIGFRQEQKADKMTEFDVLLTKNHYLLSFMVVGAAPLPPLLLVIPSSLLSDTGWLSQDTAWRGVSVIAAIPLFVWSKMYPGARRAAKNEDMPTGTKVLLAFYCLSAALLAMNAYVNLPALYAFALTVQQFTNVATFMYALSRYVLKVPETDTLSGQGDHHAAMG